MFLRLGSLYRTSFAGLSPQVWWLSFILLINRSGNMVLPFMTLYLTNNVMHRSLGEAGIVMGLFGLGSIVGAYFGGILTDKIGFHKVQLFSLFFGGIMFMVLGQIKSYPLICLCTFILSLINDAFRPANSAAVASYSKVENRTRSFSLNRLAINLGWAIGATLGGIMAAYDYELLFWVDGSTNIMAAILLFFLFSERRSIKNTPTEEPAPPQTQSAYRDKTYLFFIFLITLFGMCFFQLFTTIPKYFRDNLFLSEQYIGLVMALNGIIIVLIEMTLIYILEKRKKDMYYIIRGLLLCSLAFLSLLIPGNGKIITLIMVLFITLGEIISMPFMNTFWINRSNSSNRGQYGALYTIAWGIGQTLGPVLCALVVEASSFEMLFIILSLTLVLVAVGMNSISNSEKIKQISK